MRYSSIKSHLRPYSILARRKTTITHAFAAAVASYDIYDDEKLRDAIRDLGQNPDSDLECVYCGNPAETWDHVTGIVRNRRFSGHGHTVGNLLPCCKPCNSKKGNKNWKDYLYFLFSDENIRAHKIKIMERYLQKHSTDALNSEDTEDNKQLNAHLDQILELMRKADEIAGRIRERKKNANKIGS